MANTITGNLEAKNAKIAIIVTRWNDFITSRLLDGALNAIELHGGSKETTVYWCPGAFEIPILAQKIADSKQFDAIIAIGAVIRGATPHFEYVAGEATKGIAKVSLDSKLPIINCILTTNSIEQAIERAGTKMGNKGYEAATVAIEMVNLLNKI
jgi:6,7-dimethyl-8-ribityllumazine synthase